MSEKVAGTLSTSIKLDTAEAAANAKNLRTEVRQLNTEWKSQEAVLKSTGDNLGAAEAKMNGLSQTAEKQKQYINALKMEQQSYNDGTENGAKKMAELQSQIEQATAKYNKQQQQLAKTKEAVDYYKSGLSELNSEMKQNEQVANSRISRLEAEGKSTEAAEEKAKLLRSQVDNLSEAYEKQVAQLNKLEQADNVSSESMTKQRVRVNEVAESLAKAKSELTSLEKSGKIDLHLTGLSRAKEQVGEIKEKWSGLKTSIAGSAIGNTVANMFTSSLATIGSHLREAAAAGAEYDKEQQVMQATWNTLTGSASKGKDMVKSVNDMSTAFGQSSDLVNELDQQFYHVFNNKGQTEDMTKAILTMSDTIGMSSEETTRLGLNFTHMMTSGRMQLGDFNMITDQLPMYGEKLLDYERKVQKNSQLTMAQLRDQMSAGKISAKDAEAVMEELGDKYAKASENMMGTMSGMERVISARGKALAGALINPILQTKNPLFEAVSKWVSDQSTMKEFDKVGDAFSKGLGTITTAFGKLFKGMSFNDSANKFMDSIAHGVDSASKVIAAHAPEIVDGVKSVWNIIKILAEIGEGAFKAIVGGVESLAKGAANLMNGGKSAKTFSDALGDIAKHKEALKTIGAVIAGLWATSKMVGFASKLNDTRHTLMDFGGTALDVGKKMIFKDGEVGAANLTKFGGALRGLGSAFATAGKFLLTNPFGILITALTVLGVALFELYKHNAKFREFVNGMVKSVENFGKSVAKGFNSAVKAVVYFGKTVGKSFNGIVKSVSNFVGNAVKEVEKVGSKMLAGLKKGWNAFVKGAEALFKTLGKILLISIALPVGLAVIIWKPIQKILASVINSISKWWKANIAKPFAEGWKDVTSTVSAGAKTIEKTLDSVWKAVSNTWKSAWNAIFKFFDGIWNSIKRVVTASADWIGDRLTAAWKIINNAWKLYWNAISKFYGGIWDDIKRVGSVAVDWIADKLNGIWKVITSAWNYYWNAISKFWGSIWDGIRLTGEAAWNWVSDKINGFLKSVSNVWNDTWTSVGKFFGSIWDGIKSDAKTGFNDVIGVINTGIGAIDSVIHDFGGSEHALKLIPKFANGTPGAPKGLALVNDEKSSDYKEAIIDNKGEMKILQGRNRLVNFEGGETVIPASATKQMMNAFGINAYADGTSGWFGSITGWVKDKWDTLKNVIKDPVKALTGVMNKAVNVAGKSDFVQSFAPGASHALLSAISDPIKKMLKQLSDKHDTEDGGGQHGNPGGAGVQRWADLVKKALAANGLSTADDMIQRVLRQINTESGGNAGVTQPGADPDGDGSGPAIGLMQTKRATFNANAFPGHTDIFNGYDNILAGLHYAKNRYGDSLSFLGNGHGYANGGLISQHGLYEVAERNMPEMIIPLDQAKRSRAKQLLNQVTNNFAATDPHPTISENATVSDLSAITQRLDGVVKLLQDLIQAVYGTAITQGQVYDMVNNQTKQLNTLNQFAKG